MQGLIPFIFNTKNILDDETNVLLSRWIFTEAQTGKTRLVYHCSFLNKFFQEYLEDDNDIIIGYDIVKDISFNGGFSVTAAVLVGAVNLFGKRALKKNLH